MPGMSIAHCPGMAVWYSNVFHKVFANVTEMKRRYNMNENFSI